MESDHRGDIGFPEAVIGTVAVCIVLSSFIVFAYGAVGQEDLAVSSFDIQPIVRQLAFVSGSYTIDTEFIATELYSGDISGVTVSLTAPGVDGVPPSEWSFGETSGDHSVTRRLVDVMSDDGRRIPTLVTVGVYP